MGSGADYVKYVYSATGSKLRKEVYMGNTLASTTDYCGGKEFLDGALRYLYNGKELQDVSLCGVSLGLYNYGWKFYDPVILRFPTVDLLNPRSITA